MSELALRWTVAGVGVPVVIALLYFGGWVLAVPVAGLAAVGAVECCGLAGQKHMAPLAWLGALGAAGLVLLSSWRPTFGGFAPGGLALLGIVTLVALVWGAFSGGEGRGPLSTASATVLGVAYAGLSLAFVPMLRAIPETAGWSGRVDPGLSGVLVVAFPLAATWVGDATAFFAGTAWGRKKLAPTISPKKSWVGAYAGVIGAGAAAALWSVVATALSPDLPLPGIAAAAALGALMGVGAIVGDLIESALKREAGVKDSGALFPGHGGVLDRLDALIINLPMAYLFLIVLGERL